MPRSIAIEARLICLSVVPPGLALHVQPPYAETAGAALSKATVLYKVVTACLCTYKGESSFKQYQ